MGRRARQENRQPVRGIRRAKERLRSAETVPEIRQCKMPECQKLKLAG
ncbi:hypothetical protein B4135_1597 [Caldibacillus debilis]|uniref:Uncharacterized protein n=1 Tax=Caldibacillus debilis TaxID=301148 RepID=A0A150MC17_9BACI|nr:hypothetical protein B4135_1597 [Caldibacillus debilis]